MFCGPLGELTALSQDYLAEFRGSALRQRRDWNGKGAGKEEGSGGRGRESKGMGKERGRSERTGRGGRGVGVVILGFGPGIDSPVLCHGAPSGVSRI